MKESEFYQRASRDPAFRRAKLEDLRYFKGVGAGLVWFCVAAGAAFSLYAGFREGKWDAGSGLLVVAALSAYSYAMCATRIAALQAFEDDPNRAQPQNRSEPAK